MARVDLSYDAYLTTPAPDYTPTDYYEDTPEPPWVPDMPNLTLRQALRHERWMARWLRRLGRREDRRRRRLAKVAATYQNPTRWRAEVREGSTGE